jgi:hypothetical protein
MVKVVVQEKRTVYVLMVLLLLLVMVSMVSHHAVFWLMIRLTGGSDDRMVNTGTKDEMHTRRENLIGVSSKV